LYSGRKRYSRWDWTTCGNVIRHNFIHHIPRANGTYHDDRHAGDSIYLNIIHGAIDGTLIGGGHDNYVKNNIYLDCIKASIVLDSRGKSRNYNKSNDKFMYRFRKFNLDRGLWKQEYPEMSEFLKREHLELPNGNEIGNNIIINSPDLKLSGDKDDFRYSKFEPNTVIENNKDNLIQMLIDNRDESALNGLNIKVPDIDLKKTGLYKDKYRHSLPDVRKIVASLTKGEEGFDSSQDVKATNAQ